MKIRVTDNGLPRSVATTDELPETAYLGALIFCEADSTLYVYNGEEFAAVTSVETGETSGSTNVSQLTVYSKVGDLPSEGATEGAFVYVESTKAPYLYTGSAWKKVGVDATGGES